MRFIEDTRKRWTALFCDNNTPSDLRAALKSEQGNICSDGLRSICWKAFLLFDDLDRTQWPEKINDVRSAYSALREHLLKYIEHPDDLQSTIDPLTDDEESPWQALRRDEQTRADISQDVERCLQENYFFREPATKAKMIDVLFIYTKLNPDLGYRQGMHEMLAPILWVVDRDAIEPNSSTNKEDDLMLHLLDSTYVEHDCFTLFCAVMQTTRVYYEHSEQRSASGTMDVIPLIHRCQYIHQDILTTADPELADHLLALEILPQIFLTRWMRLLFGREFPFEDVLVMWDHFFAEGLRPELVDFVCVAMMLRIRWQLLAADCSSALALLLRFPSPHPHGPQSFVYDGIYLEQNPTSERGRFIISKYSGKPPDFSRRPRQAGLRPASGRRAQLLGDWRDSSEGSSPARSPARNSAKGLDTIFQDVSEGIQRRTESWGVTKAVRGAVTEARKNMQTMQSEGHPRITRYDDGTSFNARNASWSQESETAADLRMRVDDLEERNRLLAKSLSKSLNDLRSHMMSMSGDKADTSATAAIKQALTRVQSVQACLEDPSASLQATADTEQKETKEENEQSPTVSGSTSKPDTPEKSKSSSSLSTTSEPPSRPPHGPKTKPGGPTSMPLPPPARPSPRPSLANSEFSWMLGGNNHNHHKRHLSGFASSASVPPEQARHGNQVLFGAGEEEKTNSKGSKGSKRASIAEPDGLAMRSLRGPGGFE